MKPKTYLGDKARQPHLGIQSVNEYVLLPGDPDRIDKMLALLEETKEDCTKRGFRICSGSYKGIPISLVSSGMGCPSASIAMEELANAGAKTVIRVGTCGGLLKEMQPGDLVIPDSVACQDGTTKEYGCRNDKLTPSNKVFDVLVGSAKRLSVKYFTGTNRTHDAFYEPLDNFVRLAGKGFVSSEMECSSVFMVSKVRGIDAGAVLVVNTPEPPEDIAKDPSLLYRLVDAERVNRGSVNAIRVALEAIKTLESGRE